MTTGNEDSAPTAAAATVVSDNHGGDEDDSSWQSLMGQDLVMKVCNSNKIGI